MKPVRGFSLIELMIVVAIVSILASIAIPAYRDYVMRGKMAEAYTVLASQRVKMEQYYQDRRTYDGACVDGTVAPNPTGKYFTYKCDIKDQIYTISASGITAQGVPDFVFTIDQSNNRATANVHTGWTMPSPNTCWTRSKDGKC